jgi:hypothetical protein
VLKLSWKKLNLEKNLKKKGCSFMVYVIKEAIEGKHDAHRFFIRFGRGKFENRFVMEISKKIKGSYDNVFSILLFLSSLSDLEVKGIILAKQEIDKEIEKENLKIKKKSKKTLYEYEVEGRIEKEGLRRLRDRVYYFLLDAKANGIEFKCKKKLPRPSKKNVEIVKKDFFSLSLNKDFFEKFRKEFLFDFNEESKKIEMGHDIIVENIIFPENIQDYEKLREIAKREGKIIRKIRFDDKEIKKEYSFRI